MVSTWGTRVRKGVVFGENTFILAEHDSQVYVERRKSEQKNIIVYI